MNYRKLPGFTIVELLVVILILAVLIMITASLYQSAQVQARDARNIDGVDKISDAIQLFIAKNQHFPKGGSGSTTAIGAGTECADGSNGWEGTGLYTCTVEDTLVASGYIPAGFTAGLSPNTQYANTNGIYAPMVYSVSATTAMVMTSLESPSSSDTARFNAELTKCYGSVPGAGAYAPRDTYNMKYGICITFQTF